MTGRAMEAEIVGRRLVYDGWCRLHQIELRMPDGEVVERHLEDHGTAVAVLPYDPERRVALLITQPRASVIAADEPPVLEVPAGGIESDDIEACARREAMEEAGLRLGPLQPVANIWSLIGLSTERMQLYLAPYAAADRVAAGGGAEDENEGIMLHEIPLATLRAMAMGGMLTDAKTLMLVLRLVLERPDLFD